MPKKNDEKAYGAYVRSVRERLGLDRDVFAGRIGVSSQTLRNVEGGHQPLGKPAKMAVERLDKGGISGEMPVDCSVSAAQSAEMIARFVVDDELREKAKQVAEILGMPYRDAVAMVVRERLLKK